MFCPRITYTFNYYSAWSEDGCHIDQTNRTHTVCMCNHLTNFAILMDVIDDSAQFIQQIGVFDKNMRILITISIVVSIIFIIIVLLTLKFYNGIFMKVRRNADAPTTNSSAEQTNSVVQINHIDNTSNRDENQCRQMTGVELITACQTIHAQENPENLMPNNDCTIVNNFIMNERISLNHQLMPFNHHHHHHHHHHHYHGRLIQNHNNFFI